MQQVADWLEKLGMSEYAQRFAENDVDFAILPDLTDQDLKDLGVASLGHRRKILRAIAEFGNAPAVAAAPASPRPAAVPPPAPAAAPPPAPTAEAAGERRYLTVMFCDLVGSTAIAAQLDAEEWRDLVGSYLDAASAAVTEMGGHVAKKLGDGILALFGYPVAHENDAERAARAALAIQRALAELNRKNAGAGKPELKARIGLDTGPAVLDASGEIYGDVANIAARVQTSAEPGAIVITARVQRQIAGLFVAEDRGEQALKGVPEPTALFKLVRASGGGRRAGQRQLTPLVGRDDEMAMLMRRWQRARAGDGQLVMIVGEPGLGKSRLIEEFHARLADTPHTWVEWSCSQLLQNTPLHPIAEWGRQRFGGADVPAERRLADLESSLAQVKLAPAEMAPLLAPLLDMPLPAERMPKLSGEELRRRQLAALTNWTMASAKTQPVVLAFEDLHWADPTTIDVLRGIAEQGALAPLFILATTRPEFRPPWSMRSHHGTISLAPLDRAQVRDMVGELSARHALPRDVVEDVAARTGGVPLFVEEVTRLLLERGGESGIQAIPPTLQQSLMARLDRLGPAREVAQVGSVIGRGFSYKLLRDVAGLEDAPLNAALEKLAEADIVLVRGQPPDSDYRFKHALIQDAAYENLLKSRRQVLHRRVAEILRDRFADTAAAEPEVLAHHFTQAGMTDAAIEWWGKAGDQALRRSAFQEAISHLGKAIEMADKSGEGAPRPGAEAASAGQRTKLQTSYGQALIWGKGYAAPETAAAFARARDLAAGTGNTAVQFETHYGQWGACLLRGDLRKARDVAEAFLRETEGGGPTLEAGVALRTLGLTCFYQGELVRGRTLLDDALKMHEPDRDRAARFRFGMDLDVTAMAYLAWASWLIGDGAAARELVETAEKRALDGAHVPTLAQCMNFKVNLNTMRGDASSTLRDAEILGELGQKHGMPLFSALGTTYRGWARSWLGDRAGGLADMRAGLAAFSEQGIRLYGPLFQGLLAGIEAEGEGVEGALARIDEALALAGETGERWADALLHRIRGEILLKRDPANTASAEGAFLTAIAIAQQQKAKTFELRAAHTLAKLYQSTGRAADAHAVLAPAIESFSPTPEFPEIEQAQMLLAALAETDDVKNAAAARQRRLKLQTSYGQALMWSKGYASEETKAAVGRARELAESVGDPSQRFDAYYGLWAGHLLRAELNSALETAAAFLRDAEKLTRPTEAAVAQRFLGLTILSQSDFMEARARLGEALRIYDTERDRDAKFRFGTDTGAVAAVHLAQANWLLGSVNQARDLMQQAVTHAGATAHPPTVTNVDYFRAVFEVLRGDARAALRTAQTLLELTRQHGLSVYVTLGTMCAAWARARLGEREIGVVEFREALAAYTGEGNNAHVPLHHGLLAELEADAQDTEAALTRIDAALALANKTGERWTDSFLHRIRGEILLKRDSANTAPAEEAFLTAIAIAQQQKAKSFELRAALALAKLYQSTARAAEAHAVLAPALEGFSPTPEFPEIEEAQALLSALAETDEVKDAAAARQRRLKLQTSFGQAMLHARGYSAPETTAAFARAHDLAAGIENPFERFSTYWGLWAGGYIRGDATLMRQTAHAARAAVETSPNPSLACVAHRMQGVTSWVADGDVAEALVHFERSAELYDAKRDREYAFRFGQDIGVAAKAYLAIGLWLSGEPDRARAEIEQMMALAVETEHVPTLIYAHHHRALFETIRLDPRRAKPDAEVALALAKEHRMSLWQSMDSPLRSWAAASLASAGTELDEMLQALQSCREQGVRTISVAYLSLLALIQAGAGRLDDALETVTAAIADLDGVHFWDAEFYRIRGEILLKRDPANTAPAEEAFFTAIAIAQQQKAKSFELRAALALAKLYQSNNRAADTHAVLAPALAGFSPTPEFPEIAEAQKLLAVLTGCGAAAS